MNSTNLNQVVSPLGAMAGLMPPTHVGQRIGMPSTVKRPFSPRGLQALPIPSSLSGHLPRGGLSSLKLASGGLADFETIALDAARHGHARDAIGDYLSSRMAEGGGVGHEAFSPANRSVSLVSPIQFPPPERKPIILPQSIAPIKKADGGLNAARFDPWRQRGQLRGRLKEGEDQDGSKLLASLLGLDDPSSMGSFMKPKSVAAMWAGIPSSGAGVGATLGLHSGDAAAPDLMEYLQSHPDYARALANYYQSMNSKGEGSGLPLPPVTGSTGDLPTGLQAEYNAGRVPGRLFAGRMY